jgi:O-antigen/teichoic acid export membrane protein
MKELLKYALPIFPTSFLVLLNTSLSQLMLNQYVDYSVIGIYSNAVTIANIITIIQSGLNSFWTPFVYEYYKEQKKIQKMHHIISFLMICMAFVITGFSDLIYLILVNNKYWESKRIMAFLLISPICDTISETLGLGIELSKKTYLKLPVYVINIIVNVVSCMLLIPQFGLLGAAMANALASISMLAAKSMIGERFYKCSDTYYRIVIGGLLLIGNAFLNYFYNMFLIKIISSCIGILIMCLLYRESFVLILKNANNIISTMLEKVKSKM